MRNEIEINPKGINVSVIHVALKLARVIRL